MSPALAEKIAKIENPDQRRIASELAHQGWDAVDALEQARLEGEERGRRAYAAQFEVSAQLRSTGMDTSDLLALRGAGMTDAEIIRFSRSQL
jgi:hypothetical protein